ncbi:ATP-binding protein [Apilactobacillus ozensis]|uniref:ATP-binding protein n=1 Tax=Apilactobacillus ozensis TaxID=866801 RepID=UPI002009DF1C|nr:ATP-binding protein [Apilactobacillus ozensis]MCK8606550.1 ATP-binding protein [Apilactobacillus ozensis]
MGLTYNETLKAVQIILNGNNVPNIVGNAGIGKSALVQELANKCHAKLFTTVVSLSEKGDLSIPVPPLTSDSFIQTEQYGKLADVQYGYSHTLIEIITYAQSHPNDDIYWFLDEFNRGSQAVQSELMNVVLQRQVNSLKLPRQVKIIIAENPDSTMSGFERSNYSVSDSDDAIKDRTTRIIMDTNTDEWLKWADSAEIHPMIIKYLGNNPDMLIQSHSEDLHPTPRAWHRVSDNLKQLEKENLVHTKLTENIIAGDLGVLVAHDFIAFLNKNRLTLNLDDFLNDSDIDLKNSFNSLDEVAKNKVLFNLISQIDSENKLSSTIARKILLLINLVSPDGQYSLVLKLNNQTKFISKVFSAFKSTEDIEYSNLYNKIQEIAFIEFR